MKFNSKQINHQPKSKYLGKETKPIIGSNIEYDANYIWGDFNMSNRTIYIQYEED